MDLGEPIDFDADEDFKKDLERIKKEDKSRLDNIQSRCEKIRRKPFTGEWKGHKMDGLYGEHIDNHWVILYELEPDLSPNSDRDHIDEIYFHRVVHHDKQESAVTNISKIGSSIGFEVFIPYAEDGITDHESAYRIVSSLYDSEIVFIDVEEYNSEGIVLEGGLAEEDDVQEIFESHLPSDADIEYFTPDIADLVE